MGLGARLRSRLRFGFLHNTITSEARFFRPNFNSTALPLYFQEVCFDKIIVFFSPRIPQTTIVSQTLLKIIILIDGQILFLFLFFQPRTLSLPPLALLLLTSLRLCSCCRMQLHVLVDLRSYTGMGL